MSAFHPNEHAAVLAMSDWEAATPRGGMATPTSDLSVLGKRKRIFDVDAKIADGVLDLDVAKQDLHGSQVAGRLVDQGCLGAAQ